MRSASEQPPSAEPPAEIPTKQPAMRGAAGATQERPHPIFSLPDLDDDGDEYRYQCEESVGAMGRWIEQRKAGARKPFMPHFDEICMRVKRGEFETQGAIALAYKKTELWARNLRKVAVEQNVFRNDAEWWSYFKATNKQPSTYNPQLTSRKPTVGGSPQLTRATFEKVMLEKQDCFTFDFLLQLLRLRCWARVEDLTAHFRQPPAWTAALRTLLIREGHDDSGVMGGMF